METPPPSPHKKFALLARKSIKFNNFDPRVSPSLEPYLTLEG